MPHECKTVIFAGKDEIMPRSLKGMLETILVVDDDEEVLQIVVAILKHANFRVLSANSGPHALKVAKKTDGKIDLLLSDVDMPEMSGPDLGETMKKTRLDLHVMLMSGERKEIFWFSITAGPLCRSRLWRPSWFKWLQKCCIQRIAPNSAARSSTAARTPRRELGREQSRRSSPGRRLNQGTDHFGGRATTPVLGRRVPNGNRRTLVPKDLQIHLGQPSPKWPNLADGQYQVESGSDKRGFFMPFRCLCNIPSSQAPREAAWLDRCSCRAMRE